MNLKLRQGAVVLLFSFLFTGQARGGLVIQFTGAADGGTVVDLTGAGVYDRVSSPSTTMIEIVEPEFVQGKSYGQSSTRTGSLRLLNNAGDQTGIKSADLLQMGHQSGRDLIRIVWNTPLDGDNYIADLQAVFSVAQLPFSQLTLGSYSVHSASNQPFGSSVSVAVVSSSPEPSSIMMMVGLAAIGIATRRRKRWRARRS